MVQDKHGRGRLPSRAGRLTVVRTDSTRWLVVFETKASSSTWHARDARMDGWRVIVDGDTVFAPASVVARGPKLPIPEHPTLTEFRRLDYESGGWTVHRVNAVEKWPDPNREWNENDALVVAVCGYQGWVQPKHMTATVQDERCRGCWGDQPLAAVSDGS